MGHALTALVDNERVIARAFADTFFSADARLGRAIYTVLLLLEPWTLLQGAIAAIFADYTGSAMTQDRALKASGLFALNGLFVGIAVSAFIPGSIVRLAACIPLVLFVNFLVIAIRRFLLTWDLPVLVLPYCLGFWCLQGVASASSRFHLASAPAGAQASGIESVLTGALVGFSQIFFSAKPSVGCALMAVLMIFASRRWLYVPVAAALPAFIAWLALGDHWAISSGLASFGGILLLFAYHSGALSLLSWQIWSLIAASGLVEVVTLQLAGMAGMFALSASYVLMFWLARLSGETRRSGESRGAAVMTW